MHRPPRKSAPSASRRPIAAAAGVPRRTAWAYACQGVKDPTAWLCPMRPVGFRGAPCSDAAGAEACRPPRPCRQPPQPPAAAAPAARSARRPCSRPYQAAAGEQCVRAALIPGVLVGRRADLGAGGAAAAAAVAYWTPLGRHHADAALQPGGWGGAVPGGSRHAGEWARGVRWQRSHCWHLLGELLWRRRPLHWRRRRRCLCRRGRRRSWRLGAAPVARAAPQAPRRRSEQARGTLCGRQVWYEDPESLTAKLQGAAGIPGLRGVGIWCACRPPHHRSPPKYRRRPLLLPETHCTHAISRVSIMAQRRSGARRVSGFAA